MEKEPSQDDQNPSPTKPEHSPRKQPPVSGDRLKRDEWSEGAVSSLLEAYESKWILRNRAKLKGQDWEDVAKHVSSRANNTKSPKTQTQCKNKIESMKKRYRSEFATADTSSWPLFSRLDNLLRGTGGGSGPPPGQASPVKPIAVTSNPGLVLESSPVAQQTPGPQQPPLPPPAAAATAAAVEIAQNSQETDGVEPMIKEDGVAGAVKDSEQISDKNQNHEEQHIGTTDGSSTPALYGNEKGPKLKKVMKTKRKKRSRREESSNNNSWEDVGESIRWLAEAVVRSEQVRMDTMRELERMRVEAEAKRGEMDLKRTEIIANTQLEIARLFASTAGKNVDSSLRIGRS